jgi:hypothetical protein
MAVTFLKGAASHQAVEKVEADQKAAQDPLRWAYSNRFWMPANGEATITFLDGDLNPEGMLDELTYWEHQCKMGGHWRNWFPCIQGEEACPVCESGEKNALVAIFTIIDHSEYVGKKGNSKGKVFKDQKKLFVCKKNVLKRLRMLASKRDGLRGATFDVARIGENSENVGDTFDFSKKWDDMDEFAKHYNLKDDDSGEKVLKAAAAYPYELIVPDHTRADLAKLGFGSGGTTVGAEAAPEGEYDNVL